jgi:predicted transposase YbfD/YdcC
LLRKFVEPDDLQPIAIDGKAVRGTNAGAHLPGAYLLSAYASRRGAVLAQVARLIRTFGEFEAQATRDGRFAVPTAAICCASGPGFTRFADEPVAIGSRENELTQAIPVLRQVDPAGKLVTGAALCTQRAICAHILAPGGPLPLRGQGQPGHAAGRRQSPCSDTLHPLDSAQTVNHAHGRTEIRTLHVQAGLDGWSAWPGVGHVCRILHQVRRCGHWQVELHYKITSLPPERASATDLLQLGRSHWSIENQLQYVRDVTLSEDASRWLGYCQPNHPPSHARTLSPSYPQVNRKALDSTDRASPPSLLCPRLSS